MNPEWVKKTFHVGSIYRGTITGVAMKELERLKPDLAWYNNQARLRGREEPFKDKQQAYLYLLFGDEYKQFLPSENGHKPSQMKGE
jgi:hypothetical protein